MVQVATGGGCHVSEGGNGRPPPAPIDQNRPENVR